MLIKFLNPGTVIAALLYVQSMVNTAGQKRPTAPAYFFGSPALLQATVESSLLQHPLCSVALSYSEPQHILGMDKQERHLRRFGEILRGGLPEDRVVSYGVGHGRQTGCDSHLLIAKDDILTHKQFTFWSHTAEEMEAFGTWRRLTNLQEGLTDPNDEWHQRFLVDIPSGLPRRFRKEFRGLDYDLTLLVADRWINDQNDLIDTLVVRGYKVVSVTNHGMEVINKEGARFNLQGSKYAAGFDFARLQAIRDMHRIRNPEHVEKEKEELVPKLALLEEARHEAFTKQFGEGLFSPGRNVHRKLLNAYVTTQDNRTTSSALNPAAATTHLSESDRQTYGKYHTQSAMSLLAGIDYQRGLFSRAVSEAIGARLGRDQQHLRVAYEACERTRTNAGETARLAEGLLGDAQELSRAIEGHREQARSGHRRANLCAALERGGRNCERAQLALRPYLTPSDALAHLRDPESGLLRFNLSPALQPTITYNHEH